jgi:hypothetical protein
MCLKPTMIMLKWNKCTSTILLKKNVQECCRKNIFMMDIELIMLTTQHLQSWNCNHMNSKRNPWLQCC